MILIAGAALALRYALSDIRVRTNSTVDPAILNKLDELVGQLSHIAAKSIGDVAEIIDGFEDTLLEIVDKLVNGLKESIEEFSPQQIRVHLLDPLIAGLHRLESEFFRDINKFLDRVDEIFTGTTHELNSTLKSLLDPVVLLPNPFDPCRQKLGLEFSAGVSFTLMQTYRYTECRALGRLKETSKISELIDAYGDLELNAWKMACVYRGAPGAQKNVLQDWIKYGKKIEMWRRYPISMTALEAAEEAVRQLQEAKDAFDEKFKQIDSLDTKLKAVEGKIAATDTKLSNDIKRSIKTLRDELIHGSVMVKKAEMVKARDNNHWMRFHSVDPHNHDVFRLYRSTDGQWHDTIRVMAAARLRARDESHFLAHKGIGPNNADCFGLFRQDGEWFNLIQVGSTGNLP